NIAVRKDVYEALEREKRPGESFTRVLARLISQRGPLEELFGAWGREPSRAPVHRRSRTKGGPT
ncbi:MAG: antitoxin VapB family protein, partial [Thermoplasmata archaeon]